MAHKISGKVSWFGGPNDAMNTGTALGVSDSKPGIAVYDRKTLGGYWQVTAPNGKTKILQQTDIGPHPGTGRKIDFTSGAVREFGYSERNFPTDKQGSAVYLGKKKPSGSPSTPAKSKPTPRSGKAASSALLAAIGSGPRASTSPLAPSFAAQPTVAGPTTGSTLSDLLNQIKQNPKVRRL